MLTPGQQLFEYHILAGLGRGGFGAVYLAEDTLLKRPVAIKELDEATQKDPVAFQRFLHEARLAGNLHHPNVVAVHALKMVGTTAYLIMEYLEGGSLRSRLEQSGRQRVSDVIRLGYDMSAGLAAVHTLGVVHRDIKPENIL
jgi:serine/threonine protein kinase